MPPAERSVLHVLPHPGGGGETYVDLLDDMPGYRFERIYLARTPRPSPSELVRGVAIVHLRVQGHDLVHVHGDSAAILGIPLLVARSSVVTFNGLHLVRRLTGPARRAADLGISAVVQAADSTVCVCRAELEYLRAAIGPKADRAVVVHNGVRPLQPPSAADRAETRVELGIGADDVVAIWVGSLDERKDPLAAIRAAEHASVTLLVAGDGPLRPEVERLATDMVRVLGQRSDVPRLLAASDLFVQTSRREGFALSLLEAMAAGLPPIVSDLPEHLEAIGDAGIGVALGDDVGLASALKQLTEDSDRRAELGARASDRVSRLFSAAEMERRTRVVYEAVLTTRRARDN